MTNETKTTYTLTLTDTTGRRVTVIPDCPRVPTYAHVYHDTLELSDSAIPDSGKADTYTRLVTIDGDALFVRNP
jgi:hypothetical protein